MGAGHFNLAHRWYLGRDLGETLGRRWQVPLVAHRLTECIESERPALLRLLEGRRGG